MSWTDRLSGTRGADVTTWRQVYESPSPERWVAMTDPADGTWYELLAGGGQRWIRRTRTEKGRKVVEETPRDRAAVVNEWWQQITGHRVSRAR